MNMSIDVSSDDEMIVPPRAVNEDVEGVSTEASDMENGKGEDLRPTTSPRASEKTPPYFQ